VQEATANGKFEDGQILRENLKEIRGEINRIAVNAEREQVHGKDVNVTFILIATLVSISAVVLVGRIHCCCTRLEDPMLVFRERLDSNSIEVQSVHGKLLAVLGFRITIIQGNKT